MVSEIESKKIYWHSRRGMLELDLILLPFVEQQFKHLDAVDQQRYVRLLECEDTDLFSWFMQRQSAPGTELAAIVEKILAFSRHAAAET